MIFSRNQIAMPIGILVAAIFLWLSLRNVELKETVEALSTAHLSFGIPIIALLYLFYILKARRWGHLLSPKDPISVKRLMPSIMVGFAGNNVLPARLGEVIRIYLAGRDLDISRSFILATMVVERLFDIVSIVTLLALATFFVQSETLPVAAIRYGLLLTATLAIVLALLSAYPPAWLNKISSWLLDMLPTKISSSIEPRLLQLQHGFAALRHTPMLANLFVNSLGQWTLLAACIQLSIMALDIPVAPVATFLVLGMLIAGISLPGAPGFVGTVEYCFVAGLGLFGASPSEALSAAIFYHVINFVFVTSLGVFYLRRYKTSWRRLQSDAESARNAVD